MTRLTVWAALWLAAFIAPLCFDQLVIWAWLLAGSAGVRL